MLGLYVSDHPLNGVAHLLATQVDTPIAATLDGDVADGRRCGRRHPRLGAPPGDQEREALGLGQLEDLAGGIEVMFFPNTYSTFGADIAEDAVVLVAGRVDIRDDRVSLIANELVVPDFSNAQVDRPLAVSLPTRQCTIEKVSALKQVLANHPGTSQVHLRLMSGDRITTLELTGLRVTTSPALMGDLKALLGPGCLG